MSTQACGSSGTAKKRVVNKWKFIKSFETIQEAEKSIADKWKKSYNNKTLLQDLSTVVTTTVLYCFLHGKSCKAKIQFVSPDVNGTTSYFELEDMEHSELPQKTKSGMLHSQKQAVKDIIQQGRSRPNAILRVIDTLQMCDIPMKQKLLRYIKHERTKVNSGMIYISDLVEWCTGRIVIPKGDDDPYVVAYDADVVEAENQCIFHVAISTSRLLRMLKLTDGIHIDATYKVSFEKFPCIVAGVTDKACHFHPVLFCLSTGEAAADYRFAFAALKAGISKLDRGYDYSPAVCC